MITTLGHIKKFTKKKHDLGDLGWDLGRPVAVSGRGLIKSVTSFFFSLYRSRYWQDLEPYPSLFQTLPVQVPIQVTFSGE
jgi:hypothetical protein